jgi:hypothetical protein
MSMKSSTEPRTVYSRSGNLIVLFEGKRFAARADSSAFESKDQVVLTRCASDGGRARVKVTGTVPGAKVHSEIWRTSKA